MAAGGVRPPRQNHDEAVSSLRTQRPPFIAPPFGIVKVLIFYLAHAAGHCPHDEQPDLVNVELVRFIQRITAAAASIDDDAPSNSTPEVAAASV